MPDDKYFDPLFAGLTRPAMMFGIPFVAMIASGAVTLMIFVLSNSLKPLLLYPLLHGILYLLCKNDPWKINAIVMWLKTYKRGSKTAAVFNGEPMAMITLSPSSKKTKAGENFLP